MKTHLRVVFIFWLVHFSLLGQEHLQWKSIDTFENLNKYSDSITCLPQGQGRTIAKNIQNNAIRKQDSLLYAHALLLEGDINFRTGNLHLASAQYNEVMVVFQKLNSTQHIVLSLIKLAVLDHFEGNHFHALNKLQRSLSLRGDIPDYYKALSNYNIARINFDQSEFLTAQKRLQEALSYCGDSTKCPKSFLMAVETEISLINLKFGNWRAAEAQLSEILQLNSKPEYQYNVAYARSILWLNLNSYENAEKEVKLAYKYALKCSSPQLQADVLLQWSQVYFSMENYPFAIEYAQKALDAVRKMDLSTTLRIKILDHLGRCYLNNTDSSLALITMVNLKELQDSVSRIEPNKFILESPEITNANTSVAPAKIDTLQAQVTKSPLIVIKGNREKIIIGIIAVIVIGLIVGLIPLIKLKQDNKGKIALNQEIDALKNSKRDLNKQLSKASEEVKRLAQLDNNKNKVFSVLTHDIRQPINQVKSVLDLLAEQSLSADDRKEIIQRLRESLDNSSHALENLLLWSKKQLTGISSKMVEVHLLPQVYQLESLIKESLDAKRVKLEVRVPDFFKVYADMNQLDICLRNLVNNAIKFSNRGGTVTIDAFQNGESKIIRVMDNGVGMTDDQVEKLMTLKGDFSTIGTMNEKGTGLGILIVKEFMEIQDGYLEITSQKGEGSIFSLVFNGRRPNKKGHSVE